MRIRFFLGTLLAFFSIQAHALEFAPIVGVMSLSASEPGVAIGAKIRANRFEASLSSAGVKTTAYSMESVLGAAYVHYDVAKQLTGGLGAAYWRNTTSYTPLDGTKATRIYSMYGPSLLMAYRPWKHLEIGINYSYGIPGEMVKLNIWSKKGLIYLGVFF